MRFEGGIAFDSTRHPNQAQAFSRQAVLRGDPTDETFRTRTMESNLGIQLTLGVVGAAPAIFFHMGSRGFLAASLLSCLTSGWTVVLLLVFHSGLPWGLAGLGGLGWVPSFFVVAVVVGAAVRMGRKAAELRRGHDPSGAQPASASTSASESDSDLDFGLEEGGASVVGEGEGEGRSGQGGVDSPQKHGIIG